LGLLIDDDYDVIVDVYRSWYEFFRVARELIKSIPVSRVRKSPTTRELVSISVRILNAELRPHLTRWQARFHRWWEAAVAEGGARASPPQEAERTYPGYTARTADWKKP